MAAAEKEFLLKGDLMLQSQANHSHRGDIARELCQNPGLIREKTKQIEQIIGDWRARLDTDRISRAEGYTFYICTDDSIMISVVSGVGHPVIYGGRFKRLKSLPGLMKYFLSQCESMEPPQRKKNKLVGPDYGVFVKEFQPAKPK